MAEDSKMVLQGSVYLRKAPEISDWNCDGCFFKNLNCVEVQDRSGLLQCAKDRYIWEVTEIG